MRNSPVAALFPSELHLCRNWCHIWVRENILRPVKTVKNKSDFVKSYWLPLEMVLCFSQSDTFFTVSNFIDTSVKEVSKTIGIWKAINLALGRKRNPETKVHPPCFQNLFLRQMWDIETLSNFFIFFWI